MAMQNATPSARMRRVIFHTFIRSRRTRIGRCSAFGWRWCLMKAKSKSAVLVVFAIDPGVRGFAELQAVDDEMLVLVNRRVVIEARVAGQADANRRVAF